MSEGEVRKRDYRNGRVKSTCRLYLVGLLERKTCFQSDENLINTNGIEGFIFALLFTKGYTASFHVIIKLCVRVCFCLTFCIV